VIHSIDTAAARAAAGVLAVLTAADAKSELVSTIETQAKREAAVIVTDSNVMPVMLRA